MALLRQRPCCWPNSWNRREPTISFSRPPQMKEATPPCFLLFSRYISTDAGILASMVVSLLVTGAFHEDGFADVCDGFGGGWTKEKILLIMKDSRIGAFGAIGLIFIFGAKFVLLKELPGF